MESVREIVTVDATDVVHDGEDEFTITNIDNDTRLLNISNNASNNVLCKTEPRSEEYDDDSSCITTDDEDSENMAIDGVSSTISQHFVTNTGSEITIILPKTLFKKDEQQKQSKCGDGVVQSDVVQTLPQSMRKLVTRSRLNFKRQKRKVFMARIQKMKTVRVKIAGLTRLVGPDRVININSHPPTLVCPVCRQTRFEDIEEYQEHINSRHDEHSCPKHDKSNNHSWRSVFNISTKSCPKLRTMEDDYEEYWCHFCPFICSYYQDLLDHYKMDHSTPFDSEKPFFEPKVCSFCTEIFTFPSRYNEHLRDQHETEVNQLRCAFCQLTTVSLHYLIHHLKATHINEIVKRGEEGEELQFKCPYCSESSDIESFQDLHMHIKKTHMLRYLYEKNCCPHCPARFKYTHQLKSHLNDSSLCCKVKEEEATGDVFDGIGGKKRVSTNISKRRRKRSVKRRCGICDFECVELATLNKHMNSIHGDESHKKYLCNICGYRTINCRTLDTHIQMVHVKRRRRRPKPIEMKTPFRLNDEAISILYNKSKRNVAI